MGVSEVAFGDRTLMSITDSTVTADTLADGAVAYGADGERIIGRMTMGLPVGHEWITMNPNIPTGCLPLLGGTYSRTAYADLWAWVQTQTGYLISETAWQSKAVSNNGNVPFYSDGDGSTTFRVPSLKCWVKCANGIAEVGSYLEAGLPNITGQLGLYGTEKAYSTTSGAFTTNDGSMTYGSDHSKAAGLIADFDASKSNDIYGNSDTVQPESIVGLWLVKAYGSVGVIGTQEAVNIASALDQIGQKMNDYEENVAYIDSFIVESWRSGTEWYRKYSDGTIEQGGYTSTTTATYPLPFANTDYTLLTGSNRGGTGSSGDFKYISSWTATGFTHALDSNQKVWWYAVGQGAE